MPKSSLPPCSPDETEPSSERAETRHLVELHALVIACASAGFPGLAIRQETREKLAGMNDPLARFLESLLEGGAPRIPPDLPADVRCMLEDLLSTFEGERGRGEES